MYRLIFLLLVGFTFGAHAQNIDGEWIVDLQPNKSEVFLKDLSDQYRNIEIQLLSKDLEVYLVKSKDHQISEYLTQSQYVKGFGPNAITHSRETIPNDEFWLSQWNIRKVAAQEAWDISTGSEVNLNDEIVIAVIDDGFDINHEDLIGNIFANKGEIPNDGIDNDQNGYIDDYHGVSINKKNDTHDLDSHGTSVCGIIGAKGDNDLGIAGVMWNTKLLPISDARNVAKVIESYQYVVDLRRKWNETNGQEGAFIVATNYSAGKDNVFGTDPAFAPWCEMYDLLGSVGVLSVGATTNENTNIDVAGDMPTTCQSDFLISVTNTRDDDIKANRAGYGPVNLDIAAPGGWNGDPEKDDRYVRALRINDSYGNFSGTSGSTPLVAGTIGLLYTLECQSLTTKAKNDPSEAALIARRSILESVDTNSSLEDVVSSGGRLNIKKALSKLQEECAGLGEFDFFDVYRSGNEYILNIATTNPGIYEIQVTDVLGRLVFIDDVNISQEGTNTIAIDLPTLAFGIYYFSIYKDKEVNTKSVFIGE